jgi:hypothetical protein
MELILQGDLGTGGQYCSELLLNVLCAHSARFHDGDLGSLFIARAHHLLGSEILKPSSIATTQALLQLSARELALGSVSQAWLYSGMAFRMVSDLGLHHTVREIADLGTLTTEDLETRKRLFWSCYLWDKAISLFLGRMPVLLDAPTEGVPILLTDTSEHEPWTPYYGSTATSKGISESQYPLYKTHAISCFEHNCRLAMIISEIIARLYSHKSSAEFNQGPRQLRERLDQWRRDLPAHLRYDPDSLPKICPPPHIVTQK